MTGPPPADWFQPGARLYRDLQSHSSWRHGFCDCWKKQQLAVARNRVVDADLAQPSPGSGEIARHYWFAELPLQRRDGRQAVEIRTGDEDHVGLRRVDPLHEGDSIFRFQPANFGIGRAAQTGNARYHEAARLQELALYDVELFEVGRGDGKG